MITLFKKKESKLQRWVDIYLSHIEAKGIMVTSERSYWLTEFSKKVDKEIVDITKEDVRLFLKEVANEYGYSFRTEHARISLSTFFRYWSARGHRYLPTAYRCDIEKFRV